MDIRGKIAVITGASSGIGLETARALAAAGAHVVLAARRRVRLDELAAELKQAGVRVLVVPADMSQTEQVTSLIASTVEQMGGLDILINNAGVGIWSPLTDLDPARYEYVQRVNVLGPLLAIQAAAPVMRQRGGGVVVNVSSIVGHRALPYSGAYSATKSALNAFSQAARAELASERIRVLVVYPGFTATSFNSSVLAGQHQPGVWHAKRPWGVPAQWVAHAIVDAIVHERAESYVTLLDHLFVLLVTLFPGIGDWMFNIYARLVRRRWHLEAGAGWMETGQPGRQLLLWLGFGLAGLAGWWLRRSFRR